MRRWRPRRLARYEASTLVPPSAGGARESAKWAAVTSEAWTHVDIVLLAWRLLYGGAHRTGGERRKIRAAQSRSRRRRAAHRGLSQAQPTGAGAGARPRRRCAARGEHGDPAL